MIARPIAHAAAPPRECPACGGRLELVMDGEIAIPFAPAFQRRDAEIEIRLVARPFLACTACEHCEQHHITHKRA
jgi:hypothetical protein